MVCLLLWLLCLPAAWGAVDDTTTNTAEHMWYHAASHMDELTHFCTLLLIQTVCRVWMGFEHFGMGLGGRRMEKMGGARTHNLLRRPGVEQTAYAPLLRPLFQV